MPKLCLYTPWEIPHPLGSQVNEEMDSMVQRGVISEIWEPMTWCSRMVCVPKSSGAVCICVDLAALNKAVKREVYSMASVDNSLTQFSPSWMPTVAFHRSPWVRISAVDHLHHALWAILLQLPSLGHHFITWSLPKVHVIHARRPRKEWCATWMKCLNSFAKPDVLSWRTSVSLACPSSSSQVISLALRALQ